MKPKNLARLMICTALGLASARAQLVNDGATGILNGITTNLSGSLIVGTSGPGTLLILTNAARVLGDGGGIGQDANASGNLVLLTGAGTLWANTNNLYVGSNGFGNRLVISDGARATNVVGYIGYNASGSNNTVLVTGAGSVWSNFSNLRVGYSGPACQLVVSNGGRVTAGGLGIVGVNSSSSSNQVVVTDAGSSLSIGQTIYFGDSGSWNRLVVSNGGYLRGITATYVGNTAASSNNVAIVTGAGSVWSNFSNLRVGHSGADNQMMVSDGGRVTAEGLGIVGANPSGSNNQVLVTDINSSLIIRQEIRIGDDGSWSQLVISNGGSLLGKSNVYVGNSSTSSNNTAIVIGTGTLWGAVGDFHVGYSGSANNLQISGGAKVTNFIGYLGYNVSSSNNSALVTGTNSEWNSHDGFRVGYSGVNNRLVVSNGAKVTYQAFCNIGSLGNSNLAVITDAGSSLIGQLTMYVGGAGSGNRLVVSNGGFVFVDAAGYVGNTAASSNNVAIVTGTGSVWTNASTLRVGNDGRNNKLIVTNGGTAIGRSGVYVGFNPLTYDPLNFISIHNLLVVQGGTLKAQGTTQNSPLDIRSGILRFNGGLIEADRLVITNAGGRFEFNSGTMNIRTGEVSYLEPLLIGNGLQSATLNIIVPSTNKFFDGLEIASNATLSAQGLILGNVTSSGAIVVGNSPGRLRMANDLQLLPGAQTMFRIGGVISSSQFDVITVSNTVEFGGTLVLRLTNGYRPAWSDRFTLLSYGSAGGAFANVTSGARLNVAGGTNGSFRVSYNNGTLRLSDYRLDLDGDGIDDGWATTYFGHSPLTANERAADADGDGQGNLAEYLAGTDPQGAASVLKVTSAVGGETSAFVLQFSCVADKTYQIEFTDNLGTFWNVIATPTLTTPSAGVCEFVDDGSQTGGLPTGQRFYRVSLLP
ncbi:MAG: hypothetical protein HZA89_16540 [Verrucomicrobia bacterium]|nr:hypothetical protein [Verrucomicrobiota bacterium]